MTNNQIVKAQEGLVVAHGKFLMFLILLYEEIE